MMPVTSFPNRGDVSNTATSHSFVVENSARTEELESPCKTRLSQNKGGLINLCEYEPEGKKTIMELYFQR